MYISEQKIEEMVAGKLPLRGEVSSEDMRVQNQQEGRTPMKSRFGELWVNKEKAILFPHGLLGIPGRLEFYLANFPNEKMEQFKVLQCASDAELSFIVLPTDKNNKIIEAADTSEACRILEIDEDNLLLLLIVSVHRAPGQKAKISVNLRAPVLVDANNRSATQYVFGNKKYAIRHFIS